MRTFDYDKLALKAWDTELLNLVAKIHECKGRQDLFARKKTVELGRLIQIARIQSTEASNKIEGIVTTSSRMKQLLSEKTTPRNRDENEIMGYRDVLNTIHESHKYIPVRPSYILQLHRDLLRRSGLSFGGKYKNTQNYINETCQDGNIVTRFTPVAPYETPDAMEQLCEAYDRAKQSEKIDDLILIPTFICDFLCIHPFNDGNGRMSRLLTLLLLYRSGYTVGKYVSIEAQIEKTKDKYYEALEASGSGWHEGENDPDPFIRYMLRVILACYMDFEERMGSVREYGSAYDTVKNFALGRAGKFTGADVLEQCPGVGRSSALAALKRLAEEGVITRHGNGRGTFYTR